MSERGSYCTEYIYCEKCAKAVFEALTEAELDPVKLAHGRIVAGFYHMGYFGEEIVDFETRASKLISKRICDEIRMVVFADSGESALYKIVPYDPAPTSEWIELIESKGGYWTSD